jgi:hypothetical protein
MEKGGRPLLGKVHYSVRLVAFQHSHDKLILKETPYFYCYLPL